MVYCCCVELLLYSSWEGKAKGVEIHETELLLCQLCILITGHLTLAQGTHSSVGLCPPSATNHFPVLAWEKNLVGSWEGDVLMEMFRTWDSSRSSPTIRRLSWLGHNPAQQGCDLVVYRVSSPGLDKCTINITYLPGSCGFTLAWKSLFQCIYQSAWELRWGFANSRAGLVVCTCNYAHMVSNMLIQAHSWPRTWGVWSAW